MSRPLYIFIHIYKTAGQTLRRNLELNCPRPMWLPMYAKHIGVDKRVSSANPGWDESAVRLYLQEQLTPEVRCILGHMAFYGIHDLTQIRGRDTAYIAFLRNPVARIVSLYNYLRYHSANIWHDEIMDHRWSLDKWFRGSDALWLHNGQLRQLLLVQHREVLTERDLTAEHLAAGKKILDQMWFVGLTEHFAKDVGFLYGALGFRKFYQQSVVNASRGSKQLDDATRRRIQQDNALDQQLYRHAQEIRRQFYEREKWNVRACEARYQINKRLPSIELTRAFRTAKRF